MKVSATQIKQWKEKHGNIFEICIPDGKNKLTGYVKIPSLEVVGIVNGLPKSDLSKQVNVMFEECWVGGDSSISKNEYHRMSVFVEVGKIIEIKKATIKKL